MFTKEYYGKVKNNNETRGFIIKANSEAEAIIAARGDHGEVTLIKEFDGIGVEIDNIENEFKSGNYDKAINMASTLCFYAENGNYRDIAQKELIQIGFLSEKKWLEDGNSYDAQTETGFVGHYLNISWLGSKDDYMHLDYLYISCCGTGNSFDELKSLFSSESNELTYSKLPDVPSEFIDEIAYLAGKAYFDAKNFDQAYGVFKFIPNYKDSKEFLEIAEQEYEKAKTKKKAAEKASDMVFGIFSAIIFAIIAIPILIAIIMGGCQNCGL